MAPLSIPHRVMHSGAQLHPDQRGGVLNSTQSNTRDPSLRSLLVTGNPSQRQRKGRASYQRRLLPEFRPKLISSDAQLATPRRLLGCPSAYSVREPFTEYATRQGEDSVHLPGCSP